MGLSITGSLAVLVKAKKAGQLNNVRSAIEKLRVNGYRYSEKLVERVILLAGE